MNSDKNKKNLMNTDLSNKNNEKFNAPEFHEGHEKDLPDPKDFQTHKTFEKNIKLVDEHLGGPIEGNKISETLKSHHHHDQETIWEKTKEAASSGFEKTKDVVSSGVDKIKGLFSSNKDNK